MHKEKGVKVKKSRVSNINIEVSTPEDLQSEDIIFYIHRGGWCQKVQNLQEDIVQC